MAVSILNYRRELWSTTTRDRIQALKMKFLQKVKGCRRPDRIQSDGLRQELNIYTMDEKLRTINAMILKAHEIFARYDTIFFLFTILANDISR